MREKLIDVFCAALGEEPDYQNEEANKFVDELIANGVTVTDNNVGGKWIPVTERLPDSGKCVLVCSKDGMVAEGSYKAYEKKWTQFRWNVTDLQNVTHWMPLPEPPKGE